MNFLSSGTGCQPRSSGVKNPVKQKVQLGSDATDAPSSHFGDHFFELINHMKTESRLVALDCKKL
jgi:hypothetical protein